MRIIAGRFGGRQFAAPKGFKTHPMSDKARGALFNILGDIHGLRVLDPFGGSGAISFEAISRGATHATIIEQDKSAQKVIAQNIKLISLQNRIKLIQANAGAWLQTNPDAQFDITLCDPPYNDLQHNLIQRLTQTVVQHGLFVLSWPAGDPLPELVGLKLLEQRTYGDMQLAFYRRLG